MGLEVFYKQDVVNALLAAKRANDLAIRANGEYVEGYKDGYDAALEVIALAFGLGLDDARGGLPRLTDTWQTVALYTLGRGR